MTFKKKWKINVRNQDKVREKIKNQLWNKENLENNQIHSKQKKFI